MVDYRELVDAVENKLVSKFITVHRQGIKTLIDTILECNFDIIEKAPEIETISSQHITQIVIDNCEAELQSTLTTDDFNISQIEWLLKNKKII